MGVMGSDEQVLDSCTSQSEDSTSGGNWSNAVRIGTGFALLVLVVGFIVFFVYKRNKSQVFSSFNSENNFFHFPQQSCLISLMLLIFLTDSRNKRDLIAEETRTCQVHPKVTRSATLYLSFSHTPTILPTRTWHLQRTLMMM